MIKFQLIRHRDPHKPPSQAQVAEAAKVRKRLMDAFGQYNVAARRVRDLPTVSPTQQQLQKAIFQQATNFLHIHMLPLKALPQLMKHASAPGATPVARPLVNGQGGGALKSVMPGEHDSISQASSNSAVSALEAEEKGLRERLIVLEEQLFLVNEQIVVANKRRKFDEVSSLAQNVEDLSQEIDRVQGQLSQLDFAGLYSGPLTPVG